MSKRYCQAGGGIDAGKVHRWAVLVDETGGTLWSKKIDIDETAITTALGEILDVANEVHWAVAISGTAPALLLALLAAHGQQAVYVPGRTVNRMAGAYRGEAKTDARGAYLNAETARRRCRTRLMLADAYTGCSTCPRIPVSSAKVRTGTPTSRSVVRAGSTCRPLSRSLADAPVSCGPSYATTGPSPLSRRPCDENR